MTDIKLSEHFSLAEATYSPKALALHIDNTDITETVFRSALFTASKMERVRLVLANSPIQVTSWIRCPELNIALGGALNSQHMLGEAVDFTCKIFGAPKDIVYILTKYAVLLGYDQIINEHTWVHISFKRNTARGEVLSLLTPHPVTGKKRYGKGITDANGVPYSFPAQS